MYVHPAFKVDSAEALALLRERAFGLLVVTTPDGPIGVHLPFLVDQRDDGGLRVALHVARANALHTHIGQGTKALLACGGPDAYISPDWYGVPNQVPTWTYTSVSRRSCRRSPGTTPRSSSCTPRQSRRCVARMRSCTPTSSARCSGSSASGSSGTSGSACRVSR